MDKTEIQSVVEKAVLSAITAKSGCKCSKITLSKATELANYVIDLASKKGLKIVVAVFDGGARPLAVLSMDGAYIASYDIALNKAFTSVSLKMSTKALGELAQPGKDLYGIQHTNDGKIVVFGGGEPLYAGSKIVGGVGVSGASLAEDTLLAAEAAKYYLEKIH